MRSHHQHKSLSAAYQGEILKHTFIRFLTYCNCKRLPAFARYGAVFQADCKILEVYIKESVSFWLLRGLKWSECLTKPNIPQDATMELWNNMVCWSVFFAFDCYLCEIRIQAPTWAPKRALESNAARLKPWVNWGPQSEGPTSAPSIKSPPHRTKMDPRWAQAHCPHQMIYRWPVLDRWGMVRVFFVAKRLEYFIDFTRGFQSKVGTGISWAKWTRDRSPWKISSAVSSKSQSCK